MSEQSNSPGTVHTPEKRRASLDLSDMEPWREYAVILHNDEEHSQAEVILQLVKALACTFTRARDLMFEAHSNGRATVTIAPREKALKVASVLRQIDLTVTLRQTN